MQLKDKVAIVTGGASGFGAATARQFAQAGAAVMVADLNLAGAQDIAAGIRAAGGRAAAMACDVALEADFRAVVEGARRELGGLHVVVNNAGTTHRNKPALEVTEAEFDRIVDPATQTSAELGGRNLAHAAHTADAAMEVVGECLARILTRIADLILQLLGHPVGRPLVERQLDLCEKWCHGLPPLGYVKPSADSNVLCDLASASALAFSALARAARSTGSTNSSGFVSNQASPSSEFAAWNDDRNR